MENETIIISEKANMYVTKRLFISGTLYLTESQLRWQKDHEFFLLTLFKSLVFPDYRKDYSVDVILNDIEKAGGDPQKKFKDMVVVLLKDKKELRFFSDKWKPEEWIDLIKRQKTKKLKTK
ncbi:MAG: hypothetical protein V4506_18495 [Bacteroidota bacterium]